MILHKIIDEIVGKRKSDVYSFKTITDAEHLTPEDHALAEQKFLELMEELTEAQKRMLPTEFIRCRLFLTACCIPILSTVCM